VAGLHKRIAAQSPDRARLVARFEEAQRLLAETPGVERRATQRQARAQRYARLRRSGKSRNEARDLVGVCQTTAAIYEAEMLAADEESAS